MDLGGFRIVALIAYQTSETGNMDLWRKRDGTTDCWGHGETKPKYQTKQLAQKPQS